VIVNDFPSLLWRTSRGETDLTSAEGDGWSWWAAPGIDGLDAPTVRTWDGATALADGGLWVGARLSARDVFVPVTIDADGFEARQRARRALLRAFLPEGRPTEGELVVRAASGATRTLTRVRFMSGIDSPDAGPGLHAVGIHLRAYDPLLYGDPEQVVFGVADLPFFPGPPFRLTPESVADALTVDIPGELPVWPVWTITGPLASFTVANGAGAEWGLPGPLTAGQGVRVRTDPRTVLAQRVTDVATGANLWPSFAGSGLPALFPFPPGRSSVAVSVGAATTATKVALEWRPAYLSW
jgi:hypothetical protein